ncbi:cell division protein FtsQ [Tepidimicrobium xylanilyticum]
MKLFMLILIGIIIYLFIFKTDIFNIKRIEVIGNKNLKKDQVIKASLCNIGENIFNISKKNGEASLKRLSYIKEANIKRKLPDKIVIEIVERKEIAIIPYIGSYIYIDDEGYVLKIEEQNDEVDLLRIDGIKLENPIEGDNLFHTLADEEMVVFFNYSNSLNLISLMKRVDFADKTNVVIELKNGVKVAFGLLDNVKYKLRFLNKIINDIEEKGINARHILFNKGDNPIVVTDDR